ncbi:MAG TPA: threonine/serine dehydratase [Gemmatimonadaceae bacterium]|nr:threonine/serine dehydratase [Gemmatimonadaceae bacterium]
MFDALRPIDIFAAARRLEGVAVRTPLRRSSALSAIAGTDVFLKLETEQVTGSFKIRGAFNAIASLPDDVRARGVVASSAGNHGLGVAWAARHFRIPATIYVPSTAPAVKREGIATLGATVDTSEPDYDAAMARAKRVAAERGATFINPCLGDTLIAGQGTVALEIIQELPALAAVLLPVGGAGLLAGTGSLLRRVAPHVRIVGAQSVNTAAMARSLRAGHTVEIPSVPTLADGLAGGIDDYALDIGRHALDGIVTLEEDDIARAILWLLREEGVTAEGAGAAGVAALLSGVARALLPEGPLAVIVSGRNIDATRLAELRARVSESAA